MVEMVLSPSVKVLSVNKQVWVFQGEGAVNPAAVFSSQFVAEVWIENHNLTGLLTGYPLDSSVYDWAVSNSFFRPDKSHQLSPKFISRFTSAHLPHFHFVEGKRDDGGSLSSSG